MKKLITLLLTLSFVSQFSFCVSAEGAKFEFDLSTKTNADLSEIMYNSTELGSVTIVKDTDEGGPLIRVIDESDTSKGIVFSGINLDGTNTISFDYKHNNDEKRKSGAEVYIQGSEGHILTLRLTDPPNYYHDGSTIPIGGTVQKEKWMNVKIVMNTSTKTFSIYFDDALAGENIPFRDGRSHSGDAKIFIMGGSVSLASFDVKNIAVHSGNTAPKDAPVLAGGGSANKLELLPSTESGLLYEANLKDLKEGELTGGVYAATAIGEQKILTDADGNNYIHIFDNDTTKSKGISFPNIKWNEPITISFKYKPIDTAATQLFIQGTKGHLLSLNMHQSPSYYIKGTTTEACTKSIFKGVWNTLDIYHDPANAKFSIYINGEEAAADIGHRDGNVFEGSANVIIFGVTSQISEYDLKDIKISKGKVVSETDPSLSEVVLSPDRTLIPYTEDALNKANAVLQNAIAMTVGNSIARVNNTYKPIDAGNVYVAPYIDENGCTLIPARFTAEAIGANVEVVSATCFRFTKGDTVIEFNMGDRNAIVNGQAIQMPTAPVIRLDRLHVPVRFAAEYFGKNVFWDDRGLIVISDSPVISAGQEEIIRPVLWDIRSQTTIKGNEKYSDVDYSARYLRADDWYDGTQWGALDAAKRFMATVCRWTYANEGDDHWAMRDQGLLIQNTLNAQPTGDYAANKVPSKSATAKTFDGVAYTRADGLGVENWGCANNPHYMQNLKDRFKGGLETGTFVWQFDDWQLNNGYLTQGFACFCDYCVEAFAKYITSDKVNKTWLEQAGITPSPTFNYKTFVASKGATDNSSAAKVIDGTPALKNLLTAFSQDSVRKLHTELLKYGEDFFGSEIFYSINFGGTFGQIQGKSNEIYYGMVTGLMGETQSAQIVAPRLYMSGLFTEAMGVENVISPLPKDKTSTEIMYSAIPMAYATGQKLVVPWDDYLSVSTRYFATLAELGHTYELPREYPYLFDNYEAVQRIGYIYDMDQSLNPIETDAARMLSVGSPAKVYVSKKSEPAVYTLDAYDLKKMYYLVAANDISNISEESKQAITNSGITLIDYNDTAARNDAESKMWTATTDVADVYTMLRENKLYENAPMILHAVNYDLTKVRNNVPVKVNNMYLPQGDTFTVNVYRPGKMVETITVPKGDNGSTVFNINNLDRWVILEICGPATVRREVKFNISGGYNGIGMGTRISYDSAYGTPENIRLTTYSEGLYSTTFGDKTGCQDEAAFIYKRLGTSNLKATEVKAGFADADGTHGVMIRDGIYSNARFIALTYDNVNGLRIAQRKETNHKVSYTKLNSNVHEYMKLINEGDSWGAYVSSNGVDYTKVGSASMIFEELVGGAFGTSPNGKQEVMYITNLSVNEGDYLPCEITKVNVDCPETISVVETLHKVSATADINGRENVPFNEFDLEFSSSNNNILTVSDSGDLTPVAPGKATIIAKVKIGNTSKSRITNIQVVDVDPVMFTETFDNANALPKYMWTSDTGKFAIKDNAIEVTNDTNGQDANFYFDFDQYRSNAIIEFDFKAVFGKESSSTGARVLYGGISWPLSLTADRGGFNWFFGGDQTHIAPIEEGKWHHIKVEADYANQVADIYIDGKLVVDDGVFRNLGEQDGRIQMGAWRLGTDSSYQWDNIKIEVLK